jgi:hypothetical protein
MGSQRYRLIWSRLARPTLSTGRSGTGSRPVASQAVLPALRTGSGESFPSSSTRQSVRPLTGWLGVRFSSRERKSWSCRAVRSAHLPVKEEIAGSNPVGTAEGRLYRAVVKNLLRTRRRGTFPHLGRLAQRESVSLTRRRPQVQSLHRPRGSDGKYRRWRGGCQTPHAGENPASPFHADVAQRIELLTTDQSVGGSSPSARAPSPETESVVILPGLHGGVTGRCRTRPPRGAAGTPGKHQGRLAQWKSAAFTPQLSGVRSTHRPPGRDPSG